MEEIMRRFCNCCDSAWESFAVSNPTYYDKSSVGKAEVILRARDADNWEQNRWYHIRISIEGVEEFRLTDSNKYYTKVIVDGIQVLTIDGLTWVIFDLNEEATTVEEARRSQFYICGKTCAAEIISEMTA